MKTTALLLAFFAATAVAAFSQVTTNPVGFLTISLATGNNFVGFSLQPSAVFAGAFTVSSTDRTRIFLTNATLTDDQFNGAAGIHAIEVTTDGVTQGLNTLVVDSNQLGAEIVLQDALPVGVADGSTIKIIKLRTIADAFGATNSAGLTAGTASTADLILVPNASGYDQYYYSPGGLVGLGWRQVGQGNANRANVGFYPTDGFLILAKSSKSIVITGEVKSTKTTVVLENGNNILANLCVLNAGGSSPSAQGRTLANSGLYTGNTSTGLLGGTSTTADLVLIWNGSGYSQFFYSTGGLVGIGWRQIGSGNADTSATALPEGAFMVLRRAATPASVQLTQLSF
jgi:uncharacterized protein (TIGR02597 family)